MGHRLSRIYTRTGDEGYRREMLFRVMPGVHAQAVQDAPQVIDAILDAAEMLVPKEVVHLVRVEWPGDDALGDRVGEGAQRAADGDGHPPFPRELDSVFKVCPFPLYLCQHIHRPQH